MIATAVCLLLAGNPLHELVEAERSFARLADLAGPQAAFLAVMDPQAILFRPGPVSGPEHIRATPDDGARLSWQPARMGVSRSADWGYTAGPFRHRPQRNAPPVTGNYVSVWTKGASGWKLLIDFDVAGSAPLGGFGELGAAFPHELHARPERAKEHLLDTDRALGKAGAPAYGVFLDRRALVLRPGHAPIRDARRVAGEQWTADQCYVAPSADLGCTFGTVSYGNAGRGDYVRVWGRAGDGSWRILIDAARPRP